MAPSSRYCVNGLLEFYTWGLDKRALFGSFGDVFQAGLQNLLGQVITFNTLYSKIEEAMEANNTKELYYWYGRFLILFIDFEPIAMDPTGLDTGFNDDLFLAADVPMSSLMQETRVKQSSFESESLRHGPIVGGLMTNVYGFSTGFVNASFGDVSPNSAICQTNITRIVGHSRSFVKEVKNGTEPELAKATVSFENILGSVHPITFSCYESVFEFGETADSYMETLSDFGKVSYNLIHKLGDIYDTIFYLTRHQETMSTLNDMTTAEAANWWFKLGIYYGTLSYLLLYSPEEIDPYDPLSDYDGLFDGPSEPADSTEGAETASQ